VTALQKGLWLTFRLLLLQLFYQCFYNYIIIISLSSSLSLSLSSFYHHHLMLCAICLYMYHRRRNTNDCLKLQLQFIPVWWTNTKTFTKWEQWWTDTYTDIILFTKINIVIISGKVSLGKICIDNYVQDFKLAKLSLQAVDDKSENLHLKKNYWLILKQIR